MFCALRKLAGWGRDAGSEDRLGERRAISDFSGSILPNLERTWRKSSRERLAGRAGDFADSARGLVDEGRDCVRDSVTRLRKKAAEFGRERPTGTGSLRDL